MTKKKPSHKGFVRSLGVVALAALALTACRAEEQDRLIRYEPGVYKGKPDTNLSEARREELRARALMQGGATGAGISGGGVSINSKGSDVRAPGELKERARSQGGN